MEFGFTTAAYVVAAVLFILSLGGLSGQESAKRAVWYGIVGMALAVAATLYGPGMGLWWLSVLLIAGGGAIGWVVAQRVQMTEMPQLVAAMHSLVGLAAVFIGFNTHIELVRVMGMDEAARAALDGLCADASPQVEDPGSSCRDPAGRDLPRRLHRGGDLHRLGHRLRQAGGQGRRQGEEAAGRASAERLGGDHFGGAAGGLPAIGVDAGADRDDAGRAFHRLSPDHGDRRGGHAGRGVDAEQLFRLGGGGDRLLVVQRPPDRRGRAGRLLGCDPELHHVQGDEPVVHR
jgi:hypothetical protein